MADGKDNLIPLSKRSKAEQRKIQAMGGKKSGEVRRYKKTVQNILNTFLETSAKDNKAFAAVAQQMGLKEDTDIKTVFIVASMINGLKDGNLKDVELLGKILGEQTEVTDGTEEKQNEFLEAIKKAVADGN